MIAYFFHTEPGGHEENQDRIEVRAVGSDSDCYVCAVADGQGGQAGASLAAAIACQSCLTTAFKFPLPQLFDPFNWTEILQQSDKAVAETEEAGYTTLLGFCLRQDHLCGASCGDSAVAVFNRGEPPHVLTNQQIKHPPAGSRGAVFVPFSMRLAHPWIVLAMTDGVWKYAGWESISAAVSPGDGKAVIPQLREKAALRRRGRLQDDFTLLVFQG